MGIINYKKSNFCMLKKRIRDLFDFFRYDIPYGIENLIKWFSIIWKDRNWGYYFIYKILRHKLKLVEKLTRKNNRHTTAIKEANKIKKCILLLDRLIKDEYHENTFKKHDIKWGEPDFNFEKCKDMSEYYILNIDRENVKTEKDKELERKDFKRCSEHEIYLKKQDLELLFKIIRKNIESWWD